MKKRKKERKNERGTDDEDEAFKRFFLLHIRFTTGLYVCKWALVQLVCFSFYSNQFLVKRNC